jgi:hypothetical protein
MLAGRRRRCHSAGMTSGLCRDGRLPATTLIRTMLSDAGDGLGGAGELTTTTERPVEVTKGRTSCSKRMDI